MSDTENTPNPQLPPAVQAAVSRVTSFWRAIPRPARILSLTTLAAIVGIVGWLSYRSATEPYTVLFQRLDSTDAGAIVAKLKEQKIPYRVVGTAIEVPNKQVHELRLQLASAGLPRGGGVGWESFDKTQLGRTELEQKILVRRAMEGELARTISSIAAVESARVHLVMPEKSVFVQKQEPASASVMIKLWPDHNLGGSEIKAIVNLVASAVEGLTPDHVTLTTADGEILNRPKGMGEADADKRQDPDLQVLARSIERSKEEKAREMLEAMVGVGHVEVSVSAELELSQVERLTEQFDPKGQVKVSEEETIEKNASDDTAAGVPGAQSNLPSEQPGADPEESAGAGGPVITKKSSTINWGNSKLTEKTEKRTPILKRLTASVMLDDSVAQRSPEEIKRITDIVRDAIGADEKRGDSLSVVSMPFLPFVNAAMVAPPAESGWKLPPKVRKYAPIGIGVVTGLGLLGTVLMVSSRRRKARLAKLEADKAAARVVRTSVTPATPEGSAKLQGEQAVQLPPGVEVPQLSPESAASSVREEAIRRATEDPATAALVLRHWLGTAGEETPAVAA